MKPKQSKQKVFVFGIDGLPPQLVFERYKNDLPTFRKLAEDGAFGRLQSTIPPSSIVAWTSIVSGKDPGETGINSYTAKPGKDAIFKITNSMDVKVPLLWDMLGKHGKTTMALNIPLTYPVRKINGYMVTDFLTPSFDDKSVYPLPFKKTINKLLKGKDYLFDVAITGLAGYKKLDHKDLIKKTYRMTDMHIKIGRYLFEKKNWDLFFMTIIGSDRLHHTLWSYIDPKHKNYQKNSPLKNSILDYYKCLDQELARFLKNPLIDDNAMVIVISDHGMDRMDNRFNLNDWLIREGYLVLKPGVDLSKPRKLTDELIDWSGTKAMASGGYQGRIYVFNNHKKLVLEITKKLKGIKGPNKEILDNKIYSTAELYNKRDPEAPDVIVYFNNLIYGVNNDVGNEGLFSTGTTVGIDDAGHSPEGSLIIRDKKLIRRGNLGTVDILQIAPTILKALGLNEYKKLRGKPLI